MKTQNILIFIGSIATIISGIIHLFLVAPAHSAILPQFIVFIVVGALQVLIGIFAWFDYFIKHTFYAKAIINGGSSVVLILATFFPLPFLGTSEPLGNIGLITILLQLIGIFSILIVFNKKTYLNIEKLIGISLLISVFSGSTMFALGYLGEMIFPNFIVEGGHGHGHGHGGHSDGANNEDTNHENGGHSDGANNEATNNENGGHSDGANNEATNNENGGHRDGENSEATNHENGGHSDGGSHDH